MGGGRRSRPGLFFPFRSRILLPVSDSDRPPPLSQQLITLLYPRYAFVTASDRGGRKPIPVLRSSSGIGGGAVHRSTRRGVR